MTWKWGAWAEPRRFAVGLALLALFLQVVAPPGFMVARQGARATLALCTGHGPAMSVGDLVHHAPKPGKASPDTPCVYAGHNVVAPAPALALVAAPLGRIEAPPLAVWSDLAPGRGLAAPPPPSQGPPSFPV